MSDALPITPEQITEQAIAAAKAGAAILHLHARDPRDGRPSADIPVRWAVLRNSKLAGCSIDLLFPPSPSDYVPRKVGLRFSKNAVTPSL